MQDLQIFNTYVKCFFLYVYNVKNDFCLLSFNKIGRTRSGTDVNQNIVNQVRTDLCFI